MTNRRERFKRLYPRRLANAVWNIQSIGKLSARTNYIYENKEVDEIHVIYNRFRNLASQDLMMEKVLPIDFPEDYNIKNYNYDEGLPGS